MAVLAVLGRGLVEPNTPVVTADDAGLTRGDGCFEGCRLVSRDGGPAQVDKLGAHLDRLARSARALDIDFDRTAWVELVDMAVRAWASADEAAMKLLLTRGRPGTDRPVGLITVSPLPADYPRQRRDGIRVITLSRGTAPEAFAEAPWLLGGVKTLSYAINMAAQREAERRGADDVIFVDAGGAVLEAPTSTVIWTRDGRLYTIPDGPNGILAGTTGRRLFERADDAGWPTELAPAGIDDLHEAVGLWLIGSVRGPVEVVELDGKQRARQPGLDAEIRHLAGF